MHQNTFLIQALTTMIASSDLKEGLSNLHQCSRIISDILTQGLEQVVSLKLKDNSNGLGLTAALPPRVRFEGGRVIRNGIRER